MSLVYTGTTKRTDSEAACGVRLHYFPKVADELGNRMADGTMFYDKGLGYAIYGGCGCNSLEVSPVLPFARHGRRQKSNDQVKITCWTRSK
jgi:hypothetical protein